MKRWERFQGFLKSGDWHVHTNYSDGENSITEMCEQAERNGLRLIAFTEHVRKELDYDFLEFVRDVEEARRKFPNLKILTGCEANIMADGNMNVSDDVLKLCDIVIASFHAFIPDKEVQLRALKSVLQNPHVDIWGHPATMLGNLRLTGTEMEEVIKLCMEKNVLIERTTRYPNPEDFFRIVENLGASTVLSSDAHSVSDIRRINDIGSAGSD